MDRRRLTVDGQGPAGIEDVREHDQARTLQTREDRDPVGFVGDDPGGLGTGRRLSAQEGSERPDLVAIEPGHRPRVGDGPLGVGPGVILGEEDVLEADLGTDLDRSVDDPGPGVLREVAADLIVARFDPVGPPLPTGLALEGVFTGQQTDIQQALNNTAQDLAEVTSP